MYLAPQNMPSAIILTLGNTVVLCCYCAYCLLAKWIHFCLPLPENMYMHVFHVSTSEGAFYTMLFSGELTGELLGHCGKKFTFFFSICSHTSIQIQLTKQKAKKEVRGGDGWCFLFLGIFNQSSAFRYLKSVVCMIPLFDFCVPGVTGDLTSLRSDRPLQFHDTHGDNIALSHNKTRARRAESFCKGICFSNRPIAINEKVRSQFLCFQCMSYT